VKTNKIIDEIFLLIIFTNGNNSVSTSIGIYRHEISDDQYFDGLILSVILLVKILLINFVHHTDGINPSVKLFNGGVK
jgi:hypothetical protein